MVNPFDDDICFYLILILYGLLVWSISHKYSEEDIQLIDNKEEKK